METLQVSGQVVPSFLLAAARASTGEMFCRILTVAFLPQCKLHTQLNPPGPSPPGAETTPNALQYWCS